MKPAPCVISVADHAGWSHVVCVAAPGHVPAVVERRRVATIDPGLPTMPYHHESLTMTVADGDALIARVRHSIADCTTRALIDIVNGLGPSYAVIAFAIREPPFPELPDTIAVTRQSYPLQCAADGMMYQLAWCDAARDAGLAVHRFRRGEETAMAATRLALHPEDVESFISGPGRPPGPPWTEEHRRAYAAGIAVLAANAPRDRQAILRFWQGVRNRPRKR